MNKVILSKFKYITLNKKTSFLFVLETLFVFVNVFILFFIKELESTKLYLFLYLYNMFCFSIFLILINYGNKSVKLILNILSIILSVYYGFFIPSINYLDFSDYITWLFFIFPFSLILSTLFKKGQRTLAIALSLIHFHVFAVIIYLIIPMIAGYKNDIPINFYHSPFSLLHLGIIFILSFISTAMIFYIINRKSIPDNKVKHKLPHRLKELFTKKMLILFFKKTTHIYIILLLVLIQFAVDFILVYLDQKSKNIILFTLYATVNVLFFSIYLCLCQLEKRFFASIATFFSFFPCLLCDFYFSAHKREPITAFYTFVLWMLELITFTLAIGFSYPAKCRMIAMGIAVFVIHIIAFILCLLIPYSLYKLEFSGNFTSEVFNPATMLFVFLVSYIIVKKLIKLISNKYSLNFTTAG